VHLLVVKGYLQIGYDVFDHLEDVFLHGVGCGLKRGE